MKKLRSRLLFVFCMLLAVGTLFCAYPAQKVLAAQKNGLTYSKTEGQYFFYEKGKKVKNDWRTTDSGYKYYFDKHGTAYAAENMFGTKHNIVVKKINKKYYGFDNKGRMVKGLYVSDAGKFYYFNTKTGVYSSATSKKYRTASGYMKNAAALRKLLGKPVKTRTSDSCFTPNGKTGKDVILTYKRYTVSLFKDNKTGKEYCLSVIPN